MTTTGWWIVGYSVGAVAVVVAAALVLLVIALARRIVRQAREIEAVLLATCRNTEPLFDIAMMNHAVESITRGIKQAKGDQGGGQRGALGRLVGRVLPWVQA